jgi:hypothetical protein
MLDVVFARELVAFYLDGRFSSHSRYLKNGSEDQTPENSNAPCANGWAAVDRITELNLMQHRALAKDPNSIQAICRLLKWTKNVKMLNLYNCSLSGEHFLELMRSLRHIPTVERVDFGANSPKGTDIVMGLVDHAADCGTSSRRGGIKKLGLLNCNLSSQDVEMIVKQLLEYPACLQINLGGNKLGDEGALAIADAVDKCDVLKLSVSLSRNSISNDESRRRLVEAFVSKGATHFKNGTFRNRFDDASGDSVLIEV